MKQTFGEFLEESKLVEVDNNIITESVGGNGVEGILKAMGADFMTDTAKAVFTTGTHFISMKLLVARRNSYAGGNYSVVFIDITDAMKRGKKLPVIEVVVDYDNKDILNALHGIKDNTFKDVKKYFDDASVPYTQDTIDGAYVFNPWTYVNLKPVKSVGKRPTKITVASMLKNGQYDYVSSTKLGIDDASNDYMDNGAKSFTNAFNLIAYMYPLYTLKPKISLQEDYKGKRIDIDFHSNHYYSVGYSDLKPNSKKAIV